MTHSGINTFAAVVIGRQWNDEDEATKAEWRLKANDFKKQHAIIYPRYQYQPRKPSEKKRRVTRRKSGEAVIVPSFKTNNARNLVITLNDDLDDETFEAMLHGYNTSLPANAPAAPTFDSVIFSGRTEESEWVIFQSQIDGFIQSAPTDADVDVEFARVFGDVINLDKVWGEMDLDEKDIRWDLWEDKRHKFQTRHSSFVEDA